jgi:hypothetical protein
VLLLVVFTGLGIVPACKLFNAAGAAGGLLMAVGTAVLLLLLGFAAGRGLGLNLGAVNTVAG